MKERVGTLNPQSTLWPGLEKPLFFLPGGKLGDLKDINCLTLGDNSPPSLISGKAEVTLDQEVLQAGIQKAPGSISLF